MVHSSRGTATSQQPERRKTRPLGLGIRLEQRQDQAPPWSALQARWLGLQRCWRSARCSLSPRASKAMQAGHPKTLAEPSAAAKHDGWLQLSFIFKPVSLGPLWTHLIHFAILALITAMIILLYPTANSDSPEPSSHLLISCNLLGNRFHCIFLRLGLDIIFLCFCLCLHSASSLIRKTCRTECSLRGVPLVICLQMSG